MSRWRELLIEHVSDGRQLLRETLDGPLVFTAVGQTYRFEGAADTQKLLGEVALPTNDDVTSVASPDGPGDNLCEKYTTIVDAA